MDNELLLVLVVLTLLLLVLVLLLTALVFWERVSAMVCAGKAAGSLGRRACLPLGSLLVGAKCDGIVRSWKRPKTTTETKNATGWDNAAWQ
jgi:K+-transporting ATPase c subunit